MSTASDLSTIFHHIFFFCLFWFLININAAFVFVLKGAVRHFMYQCPLFICFFFVKQNWLFLYFPFFVVNLIVSVSFIERLHSFVNLLLVHEKVIREVNGQ